MEKYVEIEPNKYTLNMKSRVHAIQTCEYTVYAYSETEAMQKLKNGEYNETVTPIEINFVDHDKDLHETIEILGCEEGCIS